MSWPYGGGVCLVCNSVACPERVKRFKKSLADFVVLLHVN